MLCVCVCVMCTCVCMSDQAEVIVGVHQLLHSVLFQHHNPTEAGAPPTSAVLTVHYIGLPTAALTGDEEQIKHLHLCSHTHVHTHTGHTSRFILFLN